MSAENYGTRAERRAQRRAKTPKIAAAATAAALTLAGLGAYAFTHDDGAKQTSGGQVACAAAEVAVAVPPALSSTVKKALDGFTGATDAQGCARRYTVTSISNDALVQQITAGSLSAQLWITDGPQWFAKASSAAHMSIKPTAAFASTPTVISGPAAQLEKLGTPAASWQKIISARPALSVDNPVADQASALALSRAKQALGTGTQAQAAIGSLAASARNSIPVDAPHVTTEAALIGWNAAHAGHLAETALENGSPLVSLAAAPLVSDDPQTDAALKELTSYLTSGHGQDVLRAQGYRSPDGRTVPTKAPEGASHLTIGTQPTRSDVEAILTMWQQATKPLRLTTVIDVSGSMNETTNGMSRIAVVSQAALAALDSVPSGTSIGLWEFSSALQGKRDYRELVPMGPVADAAQHAKLVAAAKALPSQVQGDTGLYDTLWATFQAAQKDHKSGQVSTVALITDGKNDDSTGGLTLAQLTTKIRASVSKDKAVDISPIAIGDDVDLDALGSIAQLTGGKVYTAKTPQNIPSVLAASLLDRS